MSTCQVLYSLFIFNNFVLSSVWEPDEKISNACVTTSTEFCGECSMHLETDFHVYLRTGMAENLHLPLKSKKPSGSLSNNSLPVLDPLK